MSLSCTSCTCSCRSGLRKFILCLCGILARPYIFSLMSSLTFALSGGGSFSLEWLLISVDGFCVAIASLGNVSWMLVSTVVPSTLRCGIAVVVLSTLGFGTAYLVLSTVGFSLLVVSGAFWFKSSSNFRNAYISFIPSVFLCCFNAFASSSIAFVSMSAGVAQG